MTIPLTCSSLEELNEAAVEKANETFDFEENEISLEQLFVAGQNLLKHAATYRQQNDYERCYAYLLQYLVLVMKKMPQHNEIDSYEDDYNLALQQCDIVKNDLSEIKKILTFLYENKSTSSVSDENDSSVGRDEQVEESDAEQYGVGQVQYRADALPDQKSVKPVSTVNKKLLTRRLRPLPGIQKPYRIIPSSSTNRDYQPPRKYDPTTGKPLQQVLHAPQQNGYQKYLSQSPQMHPAHPATQQHYAQHAPQKTIPPPHSHIQHKQQKPTSPQPQQQMYYPPPQQPYLSNQQYAVQHHQQMSPYQQQHQQHQQQLYRLQQQQQHQYISESTQEVMVQGASGIPAMIVHNEVVQQKVGHGVARLAQNEQVQQKVADSVSNAAQNKDVQKRVGNMIAQNSDNYLIQQAAQNESVQRAMGTAVSKTIGNREVQKKVGEGVANLATNREVQKKVANGFLSAGKFGFSASKTLAKGGYEIYKAQQQEQ